MTGATRPTLQPSRLVAGAVLLTVLAGSAGWAPPPAEATPANPTLIITPGPRGHPYANGTSVTITVGPNSMFAPNSRIEVIECAAAHGTIPIDDTTCDGNTAQYGSVLVATNGSFQVPSYTLMALPTTVLGENADQVPVCNATSECVLYIGENQNDFTQPKIFSAPFTVEPTAASTPEPKPVPANGSAPSGSSTGQGGSTGSGASSGSSGSSAPSRSTGSTGSSGSSGASTGGSADGASGGTLAFTGIAEIPLLLGTGTVLFVVGLVGSRRRRATQ